MSRRRFSSINVSVTAGGSVCRPISSRKRQQRPDLSAVTQTPLRQQQDSGRGQSETARHTQYAQEDITLLEPFVQCWMVDQAGRIPSTPIYRNPFLPEPSSNILLETSRNLKKSAELSGLFWTVLDPSRSFFCTAVLAQRAHWYMCRL